MRERSFVFPFLPSSFRVYSNGSLHYFIQNKSSKDEKEGCGRQLVEKQVHGRKKCSCFFQKTKKRRRKVRNRLCRHRRSALTPYRPTERPGTGVLYEGRASMAFMKLFVGWTETRDGCCCCGGGGTAAAQTPFAAPPLSPPPPPRPSSPPVEAVAVAAAPPPLPAGEAPATFSSGAAGGGAGAGGKTSGGDSGQAAADAAAAAAAAAAASAAASIATPRGAPSWEGAGEASGPKRDDRCRCRCRCCCCCCPSSGSADVRGLLPPGSCVLFSVAPSSCGISWFRGCSEPVALRCRGGSAAREGATPGTKGRGAAAAAAAAGAAGAPVAAAPVAAVAATAPLVAPAPAPAPATPRTIEAVAAKAGAGTGVCDWLLRARRCGSGARSPIQQGVFAQIPATAARSLFRSGPPSGRAR